MYVIHVVQQKVTLSMLTRSYFINNNAILNPQTKSQDNSFNLLFGQTDSPAHKHTPLAESRFLDF